MNKLILTVFIISQTIISVWAQKNAPENWFNLDLKKDKVPGVSTERAYLELLKNKKSTTVVVAVIDGGTEVDHEDLAPVIWTNPAEIPNNGIDDDKNGYVDDVHGWNFIGGKSGDVGQDNLELTRVYLALLAKNEAGQLTASEKKEFDNIQHVYQSRKNKASQIVGLYTEILKGIDELVKALGTENPTSEQLNAYQTQNTLEKQIIANFKQNKMTLMEFRNALKGTLNHYQTELSVHLNDTFNSRSIVGDNYDNINERYYGNNHYEGPAGEHGTHVAGIIGAVRNNNKGMNGVADNVRLMVVRVVPDGDERDKDIANGIRYAVDNGAKIINMSFGKSHSPYKSAVDEAVKYAVSKDVLLVHAAGNDGRNTDTTNNFPRAVYANQSGSASSWIEIGATTWVKGKHVVADFSNYGKENVDVFAPGVDIYSTIPDSKYASFDGTSMAAPVTAGVAALLRSYYPSLTANQVKDILMQSAVKVKGKVFLPGKESKRKVKMTDLCRSGAIINAYRAVEMAEKITSSKN